jgi:uncharacterized membrane protein YfcA
VDCVRMPVYFAMAGSEIVPRVGLILSGTAGALAGTFFGMKVLQRIPERVFHPIVGAMILGLGVFMMWRAIQGK